MSQPNGDAAEWIEAIAFDLATASRVVEPTEVKAAIAAHRDQVLTEAADRVGALPAANDGQLIAATREQIIGAILAARSAQTPQEP